MYSNLYFAMWCGGGVCNEVVRLAPKTADEVEFRGAGDPCLGAGRTVSKPNASRQAGNFPGENDAKVTRARESPTDWHSRLLRFWRGALSGDATSEGHAASHRPNRLRWPGAQNFSGPEGGGAV